jgi:hypothetical protein
MTVTMNVPAYLQGQGAAQIFDPGLVGAANGGGPTGTLGASIVLNIGYLRQAVAMGFVPTSYTYG